MMQGRESFSHSQRQAQHLADDPEAGRAERQHPDANMARYVLVSTDRGRALMKAKGVAGR